MILLLLTLLSGSPAPLQERPDPRLEMEEVAIERSSGDAATAYRGTLRVPIVRADPSSKVIGVDVWLFPADPGVPEGRPPLFRLNGGPGWPGMTPDQVDWDGEIAPIVKHGDLVIVGQRGIGTSTPNTDCQSFAARIDPELPAEQQAEALREQCHACRAHWEAQGYDLSGFNVIEAAADVEDVRRLLGYEKIAILGGSFGSHWGMTVMRYHPDSVSRALLNGLEGPDHTYDRPSGILGALERIAVQAEAAPQLEGRLPEVGLIEALRTVIQSVEEEPFELEVDGGSVRIDAEGLRQISLGYTARVNSRRGIATWPADVARIYQGDLGAAAQAIAANRARAGGLPTASFFMLDCGSGITAQRRAEYLSDPAIEIVGDPNEFYEAACPAWGSDLGDEFRSDFKTAIPTVIVHGTWDVSTPYENALELLDSFENLHWIPVDGGTHGAFTEAVQNDPAFGEAAMAFLFEGKTEGLPKSVVLPPIAWSTSW